MLRCSGSAAADVRSYFYYLYVSCRVLHFTLACQLRGLFDWSWSFTVRRYNLGRQPDISPTSPMLSPGGEELLARYPAVYCKYDSVLYTDTLTLNATDERTYILRRKRSDSGAWLCSGCSQCMAISRKILSLGPFERTCIDSSCYSLVCPSATCDAVAQFPFNMNEEGVQFQSLHFSGTTTRRKRN